jgi:hypothetical protein
MRPSKVAVATEDACHEQVGFLDAFRDRLGERPGVADAGRAAITDDVEPELVQIGKQTSGVQILRHHARSWSETRLDVRFDLEAALDCLLGDKARSEHDARVRRVRARRDGCNGDVAVLKLSGDAVLVRDACRVLEVFRPSSEPARADRRHERSGEGLLDIRKLDPVLRALRPGDARHDVAQVELEDVEEFRDRSCLPSGKDPARGSRPRPS